MKNRSRWLVLTLLVTLALVAGVYAGGRSAFADPSPGIYVQLPILGHIGDSSANVETIIEVQNVGSGPTRAQLYLWPEYSGFCEPQDPGPDKIECSGVLYPGSSWIWTSAQLPSWAKSGIIYSVDQCLGNLNAVPLAVEVVRKGPGFPDSNVNVSAAYSGISEFMEGVNDPVFSGYAYYAPLVFAYADGFNSWLYIQNSGSQCTSVELWFKAQDDCLRAQICSILALAPGETYQYDVSNCVSTGFQGSVWIRTSQPAGIVVDHVGNDVLMSYVGKPADVYSAGYSSGSRVAYGPLIYREQHGWDTLLAVQNLSSVVPAKVKVYFMNNGGDLITTLVDWVCPRGVQLFWLPIVNNLPGNYVGTARVESQDWWSPGDPAVTGANILAVAHLIKYNGPTRDETLEAIAYNLFPEWQAFDWQSGDEASWGVKLIGIPSLIKKRGEITTELAIQNVVPNPGFTDFVLFIYDQNGLIDFVCEKLNEKQSEYINFDDWGIINPGFRGSAVISATFWEHDVLSSTGGFQRNVVGLTAVKVERAGAVLGSDIPGDESAGSEGFPIHSRYGPFQVLGPGAPSCPGQP